MNYCFSSNITLIHCINKQIRNETSSMKWMISMNTWITIIFGRESVIQLFIEIIHSIDEKKKNIIFFVDRISLYRSTVKPLCMGTSITRAPPLYGHSVERPIDFCWKLASLTRAPPTSDSGHCFLGHTV
jgi:hypothetical protein